MDAFSVRANRPMAYTPERGKGYDSNKGQGTAAHGTFAIKSEPRGRAALKTQNRPE